MADRLGDMELFVRIVRAGALGRAGRQLGLSAASTTARLQRLEARHGVRLLHRTTRSVRPTEEGLAFYDACVRVLSEVEAAERSLKQGTATLSGPLRITAPNDLGQQHIAPLVDTFAQAHPDVMPYLHLNDGIVDLIQDGMDLGIRFGVLHDSSLVARKLAANRRVLVASPDYLARAGTPTTPAELEDHALISMVPASHTMATWALQGPQTDTVLRFTANRATNDGALARAWAVGGKGITVKSYWDVRDDLIAGRLLCVLADHTVHFDERQTQAAPDLHLVYASKRYMPARLRAFIDTVTAYFDRLCAEAQDPLA